MQQNIAIFLIVLMLFIVIAVIGYVIFLLQNRMTIARRGDTESEISSICIDPQYITKMTDLSTRYSRSVIETRL